MMEKVIINEMILRNLREHCESDEIIHKFLRDLCFEEADYSGSWKWKEVYRKKIEKYAQIWGGDNED